MNAPTTTFRGVLKQLPIGNLQPEERQVLDVCFPEFAAEETRSSDPLFDLGMRFIIDADQSRLAGFGRMRRYAGSPDLSPGRYYSVCSNSDGVDGKTLLNELMSYWTESTMVWPKVSDTTLLAPEVRESNPEFAPPMLVLRITPYRWRQRLFRGPKLESGVEMLAMLPLSVQEVAIPNVVDLRVPAVQAWFFEHFMRLEERIDLGVDRSGAVEVVMLKVYKPRDFIELLPTLVAPNLGGTLFHQGVGAWLRSHGVAGLVYPSARCDTYVRLLGDERSDARRRLTIEFSGWNFVDYRDAGSCEWDSLFGKAPKWVRPATAAINVTRFDGDQIGWEIRGAEEAERRRARLLHARMLGKSGSHKPDDPRSGFRRPYYEPDP